MKETAQRDLMGLFAKRDKKGNFEVRRDPDTGMLTHVKTPLYENVLKALDGLKDLWTEVFPGLKVAAKAFVDGLNKVISISLGTVRFIKDHPALQSFLKTLIAFTLKALPLLIAFGVAAKILGKTGKLIGGVGSSAKLFGKALAGGARLATRVVRGGKHIGTGLFSDDGYLDGYRKSRDRSRDAKKNGWAWTNRMRGARDDARARWGGGKVEAIRGYGRYATQVGSGGLIDWDDRGRRRTAASGTGVSGADCGTSTVVRPRPLTTLTLSSRPSAIDEPTRSGGGMSVVRLADVIATSTGHAETRVPTCWIEVTTKAIGSVGSTVVRRLVRRLGSICQLFRRLRVSV
ncbi:hypothetical protein GCM10020221_11220 [Streptomyces thioluteus]|uniref:Uncharacterized protein n=1 Tax=Streptomyces thioluteus TaxID=66431 RepID=A0ABN3WL98_STRTU